MRLATPPRPLAAILLAAAGLLLGAASLHAQQPGPNPIPVQQDAMHKLDFLLGHWSGPVTIIRGPGEPLHLTQSEDVESKLDGLVFLIQGHSTTADGKVLFSALATIAYDDASHTYHFRAYNDGHYIDTDLSVVPSGFSWGFAAGPVHVVNTMHLTPKGEWSEVTETTFGAHPPMRSVDMLLQHQP